MKNIVFKHRLFQSNDERYNKNNDLNEIPDQETKGPMEEVESEPGPDLSRDIFNKRTNVSHTIKKLCAENFNQLYREVEVC